jgi:hypothetical protein
MDKLWTEAGNKLLEMIQPAQPRRLISQDFGEPIIDGPQFPAEAEEEDAATHGVKQSPQHSFVP